MSTEALLEISAKYKICTRCRKVLCSRLVKTKSGELLPRPEFETSALIINCCITSREALVHLNHLCNELGLDTMTTAAVIAATMDLDEVVTVVETYHERYTNIVKNHEEMMVVIFRNHGPRAGTSLIHPHSQLIATGWVPRYIRWKEEGGEEYYDEWGRCVYCDILSFEMEEQSRFVFENDGFFCF